MDMQIYYTRIFMKKNKWFKAVLALLPALFLQAFCGQASAQVSHGVHLQTTTKYDYARHRGVVSVESFVEGEARVVQQGSPLDIILVLDVSGSMSGYMDGEQFIRHDDFDTSKPVDTYYDRHKWMGLISGGYVSKLGRMMDAAYSFVEAIEANVRTTGLDHRVGIVTFSSTSKTSIAMPLSSVRNDLETFRSAIYSFKADGATASDEGMRKALEMFEATGSATASKAVLMFTDGEPTDLLLFEPKVANDAIKAAGNLKKGMKCSIYTVGMFSGDVNWWVDAYMNGVSSNYPEAVSYDSLGEGSDQGYYIQVTASDKLSGVFDGISASIIVGGAKVELTEAAQIRDYMPPYMQLPKGTSVEDIHTYTCRCIGYDPDTDEFTFSSVREPLVLGEDGISISQDEDGCAIVSVTGFNYKEHWCGPGMTSGQKLIVNIPFELGALSDGELDLNRHETSLYDESGQAAGSFTVNNLRFFDLTVECNGLCGGESSVYRLVDAETGKILCRFALNSGDGAHEEAGDVFVQPGGIASRTLRNVPEGNYRLIEENWNWAYTTLPAKNVDFLLDKNTTIRFEGKHKNGSDSPLHTEVHRTNSH